MKFVNTVNPRASAWASASYEKVNINSSADQDYLICQNREPSLTRQFASKTSASYSFSTRTRVSLSDWENGLKSRKFAPSNSRPGKVPQCLRTLRWQQLQAPVCCRLRTTPWRKNSLVRTFVFVLAAVWHPNCLRKLTTPSLATASAKQGRLDFHTQPSRVERSTVFVARKWDDTSSDNAERYIKIIV